MTDAPAIYAAMAAVMADCKGVGKDQRNTQQGFNFRGVDAVVNAVAPHLRAHGVVVTPHVESIDVEHGTTTKGNAIVTVRVRVRYQFWATDGSSMDATVVAESFDSGDKATAKAMSVAYRICLLQTFALPTDDKDPDADTFERAPARQRPATVTPSQAKQLTDALNSIGDVNERKQVKWEFAEQFGRPDAVPADRYADALAWIAPEAPG